MASSNTRRRGGGSSCVAGSGVDAECPQRPGLETFKNLLNRPVKSLFDGYPAPLQVTLGRINPLRHNVS